MWRVRCTRPLATGGRRSSHSDLKDCRRIIAYLLGIHSQPLHPQALFTLPMDWREACSIDE